MSLTSTPKNSWSKRDLKIISKYRQQIKDIQKVNLQKKLVKKDVNSIDFYTITPKQELPKYIQKMNFQTIHSKQNAGRDIKVFKKERESADQKNIRRKLRTDGNIMFLSEIYQSLGQPLEPKHSIPSHMSKLAQTFGGDLQQWQKSRNSILYEKLSVMKYLHSHHSPRTKQSRIIQQKLSQLHRTNTSGKVVNYFKQGANYKKEIQKQLEIIYYTHSSQSNQMNKYVLIENSSKLLKKQLDERYVQVEGEMKSKLEILNDTRIQHHRLFEEKTRLVVEERQYNQQLIIRQQYGMTSTSFNSTSFFNNTIMNNMTSPSPSSPNTINKLLQLKQQKRQLIEQIQSKIVKNKRLIQSLQNGIQNSEQQLRSILVGEVSYYKMSLKIGLDCRDSGLGWILKKLRELGKGKGSNVQKDQQKQYVNNINSNNNNNSSNTNNINTHYNHSHKQQQQYQFPLYLDKKSKQFLILKTHLQDQLQNLLQQKRKFVNQIGHSTSSSSIGMMNHHVSSPSNGNLRNSSRRNSSANLFANIQMKDKIVEDDFNNNNVIENNDIPKKYRRSLKKITILNQQYAKNQSLLQLKPRKSSPSKGLQLSTNTDGLSGKRLYQTITQKIKFFDFTKAKKDKTFQLKNNKLMQYQNLLKSIKDIHIKLQDLDIQHQNHLTSHYKENKQVFFEQCAACFGYKKSYSMIIKYFSWKNTTEEHGC